MVDQGSFSEQLRVRQAQALQQSNIQAEIIQDEGCTEFKESIEVAFNPIAMRNRFERLETRVRKPGKEEESGKADKAESKELEIAAIEEVSQDFQEKNPELLARALVSLRSRLSKNQTTDQLLQTILESYPDYSLADEALDFLIQTSDSDLADKLRQVKQELNQTHEREIKAGKNIMKEAQEYAQKNLDTPTNLRDLYRDITSNPRDPSTLFAELANTYSYEKMKTVIAFVLHALGQDFKSKGPSIEKAELARLLTEARSLQAILGVYKFFQNRMRLIYSSFDSHGLSFSSRITFENLAKAFMKLILEKYPSADKILQVGAQLGLKDELIAEIIIFSQMRDAIRQVATRLYRSQQHRQDLLATFLDTLEELEEKLEEEEEEKEEEEEEEEKNK
jgi:type III secretion protein W